MSYGRKDISINFEECILMGSDFLKGVNYASKKKPLLTYWFRTPPKNIIELFQRGGVGGVGGYDDPEIDPALLELEKAWKPIGFVKQDKHIGIGDRFEEEKDGPALPKTPPDDSKKKGRKVDNLDIALLDKQKK